MERMIWLLSVVCFLVQAMIISGRLLISSNLPLSPTAMLERIKSSDSIEKEINKVILTSFLGFDVSQGAVDSKTMVLEQLQSVTQDETEESQSLSGVQLEIMEVASSTTGADIVCLGGSDVIIAYCDSSTSITKLVGQLQNILNINTDTRKNGSTVKVLFLLAENLPSKTLQSLQDLVQTMKESLAYYAGYTLEIIYESASSSSQVETVLRESLTSSTRLNKLGLSKTDLLKSLQTAASTLKQQQAALAKVTSAMQSSAFSSSSSQRSSLEIDGLHVANTLALSFSTTLSTILSRYSFPPLHMHEEDGIHYIIEEIKMLVQKANEDHSRQHNREFQAYQSSELFTSYAYPLARLALQKECEKMYTLLANRYQEVLVKDYTKTLEMVTRNVTSISPGGVGLPGYFQSTKKNYLLQAKAMNSLFVQELSEVVMTVYDGEEGLLSILPKKLAGSEMDKLAATGGLKKSSKGNQQSNKSKKEIAAIKKTWQLQPADYDVDQTELKKVLQRLLEEKIASLIVTQRYNPYILRPYEVIPPIHLTINYFLEPKGLFSNVAINQLYDEHTEGRYTPARADPIPLSNYAAAFPWDPQDLPKLSKEYDEQLEQGKKPWWKMIKEFIDTA